MLQLLAFIILQYFAFIKAKGISERHWDAKTCRMELYGHYYAKGCEPVGTGKCPQYFSCPSFTADASKCYYNGEVYNISESIPVDEPCSRACYCSAGREPDDRSQIICAEVECPSVFKIPDPTCRRIYKPGECCPYDEICVREGETSTPDPITCVANNKTYEKGSRIYFKEHPCQFCVCDEDYDGANGPGCRTITCGFGFRYQKELARGCIPVYYKGRCCPMEWICHRSCYVGSYKLELGETLYLSRCNIVCGCHTPPEITCILYPTCQEANQSSLFPSRVPDRRRKLIWLK